jgi:two-component system CheB/CheR fusion protein
MKEDDVLEVPVCEVPSVPGMSGVCRPTYIVGIGASAGGLEALERFFEHMPPDTGMAFVVVQHLSPDFKSVMDELLARKTTIPVLRVEHSMEVEADKIYLIPPKKDMIIANGRLLLTDKDPKQVVTLPIDHFFRSLAREAGERAIGIILSGTGSDGSRGIREIHEANGLVIVQSPETAKFDGMPNSAEQTGAVDLILPPDEMPVALIKYSKHVLWKDQEADSEDEPIGDSLAVIFRLLRDSHGIDFSHYKLATVSRRIERRLLLNHLGSLDEYVRYLRENPSELNVLYKDLLIGVTRFFRDAEAFERLGRDILPPMLSEVGDGEDFRIWVAGCATGEEAYSLAIVLQECLEQMPRRVQTKIFATDVHRASLEIASAGVYGEAQLADVSPQRLQRFFVRKNDGYQVASELRQMVVFARHNVLKDAPFTRLDLIACRNLLIYLQPQQQKKVLSLFHFALKPAGVLFLGPSETPGEIADEFTIMDAHWKLYRKRRDVRLSTDLHLPLSVSTVSRRPAERLPVAPAAGASMTELIGVYDALLDEHLPPSVLVDERGQLVHSFGDASRYLHVKKGRLSTDVLDMVDADLKTVLSGALSRVCLEKTAVAYKGLRAQLPDGARLLNLTVKPFVNKRTNALYALIVFEEQGNGTAPTTSALEVNVGNASRDQLSSLENELRYTKENLQATIEELETSNEELQATNEELVASNEELQSTNEELHSVNEELYSVNAEYQKKITELTELTADMDNLLESAQVHTLFLDRDLCIRRFTPHIAETFNLLPQDIGRRIDTFASTIDRPTLADDIRKVMVTGELLEHQVQDRRQHWYLLRILPYRTKQSIDGVVLTLIDLTKVKAAEDETRRKEQQLSGILRNSPHLVYIKDLQGRYQVTDHALQRAAGSNPVGRTDHELFDKEVADALVRIDRRALDQGTTVEDEVTLPYDGEARSFLSVTFPLRDEAGYIIGMGGIMTDVSRLKRAEQQAREAVQQRDRFLAILSHELRNPLGAIVNAVSVVSRTAGESERQEAISVLQRQANQMSKLLDDLLEVSRIAQNRIHLRKEMLRLDDVIDEAARVVQPAVQEGGITLEIRKAPKPVSLLGDPSRLQQLLVNLLMNAVKYTPAGGRIVLSLSVEGDRAVIRVRDTGVGMQPDMLTRVFELFVQADNALDRSKGGIGVGLTLVRAIAELHGGTVSAHSDGLGKGSEFRVVLPITNDAANETESTSAPLQPAMNAAAQTSATVVIIEDNDDSRRMLATSLKLDGRDVATARDGKEGLETILSRRPAIAIIDIGLPGLDGYQLAREVRSRLGRQIYLVALTGYGRPEDRLAVVEAGFDEHLVKPLKRGDLERILQTRLGKDRSAAVQ